MPNPAKVDPLLNSHHRLILIYLFFLASLTATIIAWLITVNVTENRLKETFYIDNNNAISWINTRFNTYINILTSIQAFAFIENSNQRINFPTWNTFVNLLDVLNKYPGLHSVNYIQKVPFANKDNFIKKLAKDQTNYPAYKNFTIRTIDANYLKDQPDYYPVVYTISALDDKFHELGFDLSSEKKRAVALFVARDSGKPTTTSLTQFIPSSYDTGFSLIFPIYQEGLAIDTVEERRQAFIGAIYTAFDVNLFFDNILKPNSKDAFPYLDLEVYDQNADQPTRPIYDKNLSTNIARNPSPYTLTFKQTFPIPNGNWEINTGVPKEFTTDPRWIPISLTILTSGILASLATFSFLLYQYYHLLRRQS